MCEFTVTLNIKVEDKTILENLLITLESINSNMDEIRTIQFLKLTISEVKNPVFTHLKNNSGNNWARQYEFDSWLSPISCI